jgi:hypothetical protein
MYQITAPSVWQQDDQEIGNPTPGQVDTTIRPMTAPEQQQAMPTMGASPAMGAQQPDPQQLAMAKALGAFGGGMMGSAGMARTPMMAGMGGMGAMSDRRAKTDVRPAAREVRTFLDALRARDGGR